MRTVPLSQPSRFCLKCGYVLDGLPENRCPECGRGFDPQKSDTWSDHKPSRLWSGVARLLPSPWIVIPLNWATSYLLGAPVGALLALAGAAVNGARRRWFAVAAIVLLSPVVFLLGRGVYEYTRGTAHLQYMGLPKTESGNIDPVYRCERLTGGCVLRRGDEDFVQSIHNLSVCAMIRLFGPMRGSYLGPYPTRDEALAAVVAGAELSYADLITDRLSLGGETIELDTGVGLGLLARTEWEYSPADADGLGLRPIQAVVWHGTCVIVRIPTDLLTQTPRESRGVSARVVVIDRGSGRPFAYFAEGSYGHYYPPVRWRK